MRHSYRPTATAQRYLFLLETFIRPIFILIFKEKFPRIKATESNLHIQLGRQVVHLEFMKNRHMRWSVTAPTILTCQLK
jgi:hypothetical protein